MKNESLVPEACVILIEKIKKQSKEISDKIGNDASFKGSKLILHWLNQGKSELFSRDVPLLAFIVNTMHVFFERKINKEEAVLKKIYFPTIIKNLKILNKEQILSLIAPLNEYINTRSSEHKFEFEKNVSELEKNVPDFFQIKKKKKTRVIEFNENGKGFVVEKHENLIIDSSEKVDIESNRKASINIMHDETFLLVESQTQLTREVREAVILRDILKKEKREYNYERSALDVFNAINFEEFKGVIRKEIYTFKSPESNIKRAVNKEPRFFKLPNFSGLQNRYLTNFLSLINFSNFEELIKKAKIISGHIDKLTPVLEKVKLFYSKWGVKEDLFAFFDKEVLKFNQTFCKEKIINYLEMTICLIEEGKINLDGLVFDCAYKTSDVYIENLPETLIEGINKFTLNFSVENFLKNQKELIKKYLDNNFQLNSDESLNNASLLKVYLVKIKKSILNFFNVSFFLYNKENLEYLAAKLSISSPDASLFDRIHLKFISGIKWWQFFVYKINPFFLFKVDFKTRLSNQLFLHVVSNAFSQIINSFESNEFSTVNRDHNNCVDDLFFIRSILEDSKIGNLKSLINKDKNNSLLLMSRKEIDIFFEKNEMLASLLEVISTLNKNLEFSRKEFPKLIGATLENMKALEINKEKANFSLCHTAKAKKLFNLQEVKLEKETQPLEGITFNSLFPLNVAAHTR